MNAHDKSLGNPVRTGKRRHWGDLFVATVCVAGCVLVTYQLGHEHGVKEGQLMPAQCPDRSIDGKILSSLVHDGKENRTTCVYMRDVHSAKWRIKV